MYYMYSNLTLKVKVEKVAKLVGVKVNQVLYKAVGEGGYDLCLNKTDLPKNILLSRFYTK